MYLPWWAHIVFDLDPFLTRPVPIERSHRKLSIGTGLVKNGSKSKKLWAHQGRCIFGGNNLDKFRLFKQSPTVPSTVLMHVDDVRFYVVFFPKCRYNRMCTNKTHVLLGDKNKGHLFLDKHPANLIGSQLSNYVSVFDKICTVGKLRMRAFQRYKFHQKGSMLRKLWRFRNKECEEMKSIALVEKRRCP